MTIATVFTERFQVAHPVVLAPMGAVSGGELAAAVSTPAVWAWWEAATATLSG
ncbi:MAG: hypothetical protein ACR2MN_00120 [Acidimicrobiales bacterium]